MLVVVVLFALFEYMAALDYYKEAYLVSRASCRMLTPMYFNPLNTTVYP
jgi:hypothetical protein